MDYIGYAKLRPGRIHMLCVPCGRKQSNMPRNDTMYPLDPPTAVVVHCLCEKCSQGCKDEGIAYLDAKGRFLCAFCGETACDGMGGRKRCSERLICGPARPAGGDTEE